MSPRSYLLVVVTHGDSPHLPAVLASLRRFVIPRPRRGLLWIDGPDNEDAAVAAIENVGQEDWTISGSSAQRGFCITYADAWQEAIEEAEALECDHVFWLESDFVFRRAVDVDALACLLDREPELAQVALMRNACNQDEAAAGGLYESRPGQYDPRSIFVEGPAPLGHNVRLRAYPWLRHSAYFTTNPNLMRRDFMEAHPWPPYDEQCEGRFGLDLREAGLDYAAWGDGSPWVEHVGVRTGFGY